MPPADTFTQPSFIDPTRAAERGLRTLDVDTPNDFVCFSHLRWGFVFQRPNHLMVRFAKRHRVFFVEEPVFDDAVREPEMSVERLESGVRVCVPRMPAGTEPSHVDRVMRQLVDRMWIDHAVQPRVLWFYTPMAMGFAAHLRAPVMVYDCMDELASFRGAPLEITDRERLLFSRVDLVFTGGHSLYRAKRSKHRAVFPFPSSVDASHFARARSAIEEPPDQAMIRRPRLGYFGVIDERMDMGLLDAMAAARPEWQIVMVGPFAKVDPADVPRRANLHWLGAKQYDELPAYLAGWDVALMPFALNESTRFISPTKTLEYLAAGKPIVSTPIGDVVRPYGIEGVVRIAHAGQFVAACEAALAEDPRSRLSTADIWLARTSWDATWKRMAEIVDGIVLGREGTKNESGVTCSII